MCQLASIFKDTEIHNFFKILLSYVFIYSEILQIPRALGSPPPNNGAELEAWVMGSLPPRKKVTGLPRSLVRRKRKTGRQSPLLLFSCPAVFNSLRPRGLQHTRPPPIPHHLLELAQVHVHCIGDAIQPSHPLMPSSPSALNLSQNQELFQWVVCSHQMTKILELELQLQHQSFQWILRVDLP